AAATSSIWSANAQTPGRRIEEAAGRVEASDPSSRCPATRTSAPERPTTAQRSPGEHNRSSAVPVSNAHKYNSGPAGGLEHSGPAGTNDGCERHLRTAQALPARLP